MNKCIPPELVERIKESLKRGEITADSIANMLPADKAALKSVLEDYVTDRMGVSLKDTEIKTINDKAKKIDEAQKTLGDDVGNPEKFKENLDFFKAKKEMDDYLQEVSPSNRLKVITGTIGRGMMLASLKSPILNIGSNFEIGLTEGIARRLSNVSTKGTDATLFKDYISFVNKIYKETGYDVSRMTNIKDSGMSGERVLGRTVHAQGPGTVRKVGRIVEDWVFKKLMGAPDIAFSSFHFADSANLNAIRIAKGDRVAAKEIMTDAMRIEPRTPDGLILRGQAILDAQTATWTNTTWASRVSAGIQGILNDVSGDLRVGDYLLPFIKTPANVIATGMDYAGLGIPKAAIKTIKAIKTGDLKDPALLKSVSRDLIRAGIGITGAVLISSQLNNDDFVGAYDPGRAQIESLRNSNYNAIRIGGKWISTDWLGPLAIPVTAIMYARKYGNTYPEKGFQYVKGILSSAANIPGIADIANTVRSSSYSQNQTLSGMIGSTQDYITSQIYSRLVPSLLSDTAKAIDPYVRQTGTGFAGIESKIPFLSKNLPIKKDIFGQDIKGEPGWSDILFGSRVKTDKETALTKEISRVSNSVGKGISFTNWDKTSSATLKQFKTKVGDAKYEEAKVKYGQELQKNIEKAIQDSRYKSLTDEDKLKVINNEDSKALTTVLHSYGFKYRSLPTNKIPKGL